VVARAIFQSAIPVVSAVGHEVDFTISDFVADVRAATPTAAAELVVPVLAEVMDALHETAYRLRRAAARILEQARSRLTVAARSEWFRDPVGRVRQRQQQIDEIGGRLALALTRGLQQRRTRIHDLELRLSRVRPEDQLARRRERLDTLRHRLTLASQQFLQRTERRLRDRELLLTRASPVHRVRQERRMLEEMLGRLSRGSARGLHDRVTRLTALEARLQAGSHEQILRRGFTITRRTDDGRILRGVADVSEGAAIRTQTHDGEIDSRVEGSRTTPETGDGR
jgi:exodeoxyribonuclease VII large subunit